MQDSMGILTVWACRAAVVVLITLVVLGTLRIVNGKKNTSQSQE